MKSIEEALTTFEKCATIQAQTFETGDYRKGNRYFNKLMHYCPRKSVNILANLHILKSLTTV